MKPVYLNSRNISPKPVKKRALKTCDTQENDENVCEKISLSWTDDLESTCQLLVDLEKERAEKNQKDEKCDKPRFNLRVKTCKSCKTELTPENIVYHMPTKQFFCQSCKTILCSAKKQSFVLALTPYMQRTLPGSFIAKDLVPTYDPLTAEVLPEDPDKDYVHETAEYLNQNFNKKGYEIGIYRGIPGDAVKKAATRIWRKIRLTKDEDMIQKNKTMKLTLRRRKFKKIILKRTFKTRTGLILDFLNCENCSIKEYDTCYFNYLVEMKKQEGAKLEEIQNSQSLKMMGDDIWYAKVISLGPIKNPPPIKKRLHKKTKTDQVPKDSGSVRTKKNKPQPVKVHDMANVIGLPLTL